jgi:hypothetical protein
MEERWNRPVGLILDSPLYERILDEIAAYEIKIFKRAIIHLAPLRWGNHVPSKIEEIELEEGDYKDPWNTDYFYDRIGPTQAVIISARVDRLLHTSDDIFMPIR